jgi:hypothetical protein
VRAKPGERAPRQSRRALRCHAFITRAEPGARWVYGDGAPYWLGLFLHREEPTPAP